MRSIKGGFHFLTAIFAYLILSIFIPNLALAGDSWLQPISNLNGGDTAWIMVSAALVLFMTLPGLALFYSGMVRKKNILSTMVHSFAIAALVSILWMVVGYSLAFTPNNGFIGGLDRLFLQGLTFDAGQSMVSIYPGAPTIPESVFMLFQMTFAIISTAIIAGAFAERMKFGAVLLFCGLWVLLVYVPTAHWVWEGSGWLASHGVLDYAGGTVVHINAGVAGLMAAIVVGKRIGYGREVMAPNNLVFTLAGAAMLWIGWFGFNAGSALAADGRAGMAMVTTQIAASAGALAWILCEVILKQKPSALGLASGAIAGLVGITPAAGFVSAGSAIIIGLVTAGVCFVGVTILKHKLKYDDSLDAFGIHGIGGIAGALLTGFFASTQISGATGSFLTQLVGVLITLVYSGLLSWILLVIISKVFKGLRVEHDEEREGLDLALHGEKID